MNVKRILLFYKYVQINDPEAVRTWQLELCKKLGLKGRIIIAHEGINATVEGDVEATKEYELAHNAHPLFGNIDFKDSIVNGSYDYFPRLKISVKPEIVHIGLPDQAKLENTGVHLKPNEVHELLNQQPDDLVVLDGRNYYEARVGAFRNAITPKIEYFREFKEYIDSNLDTFKDKQVLMYCTGGIRCERASAYLQEKGVAKTVYQIEGGIHRYVEQYPDGHFRGKNYVFDARVAVPVTNDILTQCDLCGVSCDSFENCRNAQCNNQFIACEECQKSYNNACSSSCKELLEKHLVQPRPERIHVNPSLD